MIKNGIPSVRKDRISRISKNRVRADGIPDRGREQAGAGNELGRHGRKLIKRVFVWKKAIHKVNGIKVVVRKF
jgi:hypothetical protein